MKIYWSELQQDYVFQGVYSDDMNSFFRLIKMKDIKRKDVVLWALGYKIDLEFVCEVGDD